MKVIDRNGAKVLIDIMKHLDLQVENKIPSIEGLASEDWVLEKGYLDKEKSLQIHYSKDETDKKYFHKSDLTHLATKSYLHTHTYDKSEADKRFITPTTLRDYWTKGDVTIALEQLRSQLEAEIAELATYEAIFNLFYTKEQTLLEIDKVKDNINEALNNVKENLHNEIDDAKEGLHGELDEVEKELHSEIDGLKDNFNEELSKKADADSVFTKEQTHIEIDKVRDSLTETVTDKFNEINNVKDEIHREIDDVKDSLNAGIANNLDKINEIKEQVHGELDVIEKQLHGEIDGVKDNLYTELNTIKDNLKDELSGDYFTKSETVNELNSLKDELKEEIAQKSDTAKLYEIFFTKTQVLLEIDKLRDTVEQWLHKYALKEDYYSKEYIDRIIWELTVKGNIEGTIDIDFESLAKVAWVRDTFATKEELENIDLKDYVKKDENSVIQDEEGNIIPVLVIDPEAEYVEEGDLEEYVRKDENSLVKDESGNLIPELFVDLDANLVDESMLENYETIAGAEEKYQKKGNYITQEELNDLDLDNYVKKDENSLVKDKEGEIIGELFVDVNYDLATTQFVQTKVEEIKQWVEDKGYITEQTDISGLATKEELKEVKDSIPSISGLATKEELKEVKDSIPSIDGLAKESYVNEEIAKLTKVVCLTQDDYDNLGQKDNNTFYIIYE